MYLLCFTFVLMGTSGRKSVVAALPVSMLVNGKSVKNRRNIYIIIIEWRGRSWVTEKVGNLRNNVIIYLQLVFTISYMPSHRKRANNNNKPWKGFVSSSRTTVSFQLLLVTFSSHKSYSVDECCWQMSSALSIGHSAGSLHFSSLFYNWLSLVA